METWNPHTPPTIVTNYRSIALAYTIYKLFTSTLTSILTTFGEQHKILHHNQEGFRPMKSMAKQIQAIIVALEDTNFTNKDIYLTYIELKNAFGSIDYLRLLVITEDLGYPLDAIELVGNFYAKTTTSIQSHVKPFKETP
jgi:hypothetical protein